MRRPTLTELEAAVLGFLIYTPMAYYGIRTVLAFVGLG
jgi:hypothetical protein